MLIKSCALLLLVVFAVSQEEYQDWDVAVVINDEIDLFSSNGSRIGKALQQFTTLKALTFDNVRHQFVVSDMNQKNDTIFTVQLTKETDITPIVQDLPDDVQGLAIDPIEDVLYWTDSINRTISYLHLNDTNAGSDTLFTFKDVIPQDVAIDVCRRYIYWTNSNSNGPTIERAKLDGSSQPEIVVDSDLHKPRGIAIDYTTGRLYWADMRDGIEYRIESTNLEGKERQIVCSGRYSKPFGVAVGTDAIYWTDINNNALVRIEKGSNVCTPEVLYEFKGNPSGVVRGVVTKNTKISTLPDCENLSESMKLYNESEVEKIFIEPNRNEEFASCLNGGRTIGKSCKCPRGFSGSLCEIRLCHNFCLRGDCYSSSLGYPQCNCPRGFSGDRCEKDLCDGFCLNGGLCSPGNDVLPNCKCHTDFAGVRCETSVRTVDICRIFCEKPDSNDSTIESEEFFCKCNKGTFTITTTNGTFVQSMKLNNEQPNEYLAHLEDPIFLILSCTVVIMLVVIIILSFLTCSRNRKKPATRVKRRIIVNKNVTPLTYRPQQSTTEQCEITIENCCNMNICETPCFDPPQLRSFKGKTDDKKTLLSDMDNGEDLY